MQTFRSGYNFKCAKCGQTIRAGTLFTKIPKEDGKPVLLKVHIKCSGIHIKSEEADSETGKANK